MAELKRNFIKGRMNKDLDERLIPNGSYRDALNIQVSTSEDADVGSAQNLNGNVAVTSILTTQSGQTNNWFTFNPNNTSILDNLSIMKNYHDDAETVGLHADDNNNKVYNFVSLANNVYNDDNIDQALYNVFNLPAAGNTGSMFPSGFLYNGLYRKVGIKSDVIFELDLNESDTTRNYKNVVVDVFEARHAPRILPQQGNLFKMPMHDSATDVDIQSDPINHANLVEDLTTITGLATVSISKPGAPITHKAAGIRKGMIVRNVLPNGGNLWAGSTVIVTNVPNCSANNGIVEVSLIKRENLNSAIDIPVYSFQNMLDGAVLVFSAPRMLNFINSSKDKEVTFDEFGVETVGNTSSTPDGNIITGINKFDDYLFFTDGRTEPKKVNIKRFKKLAGGFLDHSLLDNELRTDITNFYSREEHIAAIKRPPKKAPRVDVRGLRQDPDVATEEILNPTTGAGTGYYYSNITTTTVTKIIQGVSSTVDFALDNGAVGSEFVPGQIFYIQAQDIRPYFKIGDVLELSSTIGSCNVKILTVYSGVGSQSNEYRGFQVEFLNFTSSYTAPQPPTTFTATLATKEKLYETKFISFASRYKYIDNEYSSISPYTIPTFKPGGYSMNANKGLNSGMENRAHSIVLYDFITQDIPEDVVEVEILYRENDSYPAIYSLSTISSYSGTHWNTVYNAGNATPYDKGRLNLYAEAFGNVLPTNQLDRTYDVLPRKAKAQEFVANRIMYGNYVENYDIKTSAGNNIYGNLVSYIESDEFPSQTIFYDEDTNLCNIGLDLYNFHRTGLSGTPEYGQSGQYQHPANNTNNVNYVGGLNRSYDHTELAGWASPRITSSDTFAIAGTTNVNEFNLYPSASSVFDITDYAPLQDGAGTDETSFKDAQGNVGVMPQDGGVFANGVINGSELPKLIKIPFNREEYDYGSSFSIETGSNPHFFYEAEATGNYNFNVRFLWKACYTHGYIPAPTLLGSNDNNNPLHSTITDEKEKPLNLFYIPIYRPAVGALQLHYVDDNGQPTIPTGRTSSLVQTVNSTPASSSIIPDQLYDLKQGNTYGANYQDIVNNGSPNLASHQAITAANARNFQGVPANLQWDSSLQDSLNDKYTNTELRFAGANFDMSANQYGTSTNAANFLTGANYISIGFDDTPVFSGALFAPHFWILNNTGGQYASYVGPPVCYSEIDTGNIGAINLNEGEKVAAFFRCWDFTDIPTKVPFTFDATSYNLHPFAGGTFIGGTSTAARGGLFRQKEFGDPTYDSNGTGNSYFWNGSNGQGGPGYWFTGGGNSSNLVKQTGSLQFTTNFNSNVSYYGDIDPSSQTETINPITGGLDWVHDSTRGEYDPNSKCLPVGRLGFIPAALKRFPANDNTDVGFDFDFLIKEGDGEEFNSLLNGGLVALDATNYGFEADVTSAAYYFKAYDSIGLEGTKRHSRFTVTSAPASEEDVPISQGSKSIKSERSYEVGVVFCDKYGRESTVLVDQDGDFSSTTLLDKAQSSNLNRLHTRVLNEAPSWAETYKFYIKEIAPEYYNLVLHKAYDNNDNGAYAWLSFNSADANKVKVGDYLSLKKRHGENTPVTSPAKWKILSISNEVPNGADGNLVDSSALDSSGVNVAIQGQDSQSKFFVRIEADNDFNEYLDDPLNSIFTSVSPTLQSDTAAISGAVFEVAPDFQTVEITEENEDQFGFFWEMSSSFPIKLGETTASQFIQKEAIITIDLQDTNASQTSPPTNEAQTFNDANSSLKVSDIQGASIFQLGLGDGCWHKEPASGATANPNAPTLDHKTMCVITCNTNVAQAFILRASNQNNYQDKVAFVRFTNKDGSFVTAELAADIVVNTNKIFLKPYTVSYNGYNIPTRIGHDFYNCISFGNGVESDRIRDDFNARTLFPYTAIGKQSGFKANKFLDSYKEEEKKHDIIYSQIYNEKTGVDQTNQFILADKITKSLNPEYGAITKLHARNAIGSMDDVIALCENKIIKILSSGKDALFNADGNAQLLASSRVLGQTIPFGADYGCQNPESFASDQYRIYFADRSKGAILRLSRDGITPISKAGMGDWFSDNLSTAIGTDGEYTQAIIGSFDDSREEYNVTIHNLVNLNSKKKVYTVSYNEPTDGWVSFKSFIPEAGFSINNKYYTVKKGEIYDHDPSYTNLANNFYGEQFNSTITSIFNDASGVVKSFRTISYEGTQAKIVGNLTDGEYYNNYSIDLNGWYVEEISTDKQTGSVPEFIEKEGKWFNYIHGETTVHVNALDGGSNENNLDFAEFSMQGLGNLAENASGDNLPTAGFILTPILTLPQNCTVTFNSSFLTALINITTTPQQTFLNAIEITPDNNFTIAAGNLTADISNSTILDDTGATVSPFGPAGYVLFSDSGTPNTASNTVVGDIVLNNPVNIDSSQNLPITINGIINGGSLLYEASLIINHQGCNQVPQITFNNQAQVALTLISQTTSQSVYQISGSVAQNSLIHLFDLSVQLLGSSYIVSNPSVVINSNLPTISNYDINPTITVSNNNLTNLGIDYTTGSIDELSSVANNEIIVNISVGQASITFNSASPLTVNNTNI